MKEPQETITRDFPVELTQAEVMEAARALARIGTSLSELEAEKKTAMSRFKFSKSELETQRSELSKKVETGKELREVDCYWSFDYSHQCKRLFRNDTGDEVEVRSLTADELQMELEVEDEDESFAAAEEEEEEEEKEEVVEKKSKRTPRKKAKEE